MGRVWKPLLTLCVVATAFMPFASRQIHSWQLLAQAATFSSGKQADAASLGRLKEVVPKPEGWELMGVSRTAGTPSRAVVGMSTQGSLADVSKTYLASMESAGWTRIGVSPGVGVVTFRRDSSPRLACVMFRPTGQRSVTVVVQVEP